MKRQTDRADSGYNYTVSERQLKVFASLTPLQRMQWLDEAQRATWELATPETKRKWEKLRGKRFYSL